MTPQEINQAIAETQNWQHRDCTNENPIVRAGYRLPNHFCALAHGWWRDNDPENEGVYANPPNYYNSLDQCALFEKTLGMDWPIYYGALKRETAARWGAEEKLIIFADAPMRCIAYLRTKALWRERT